MQEINGTEAPGGTTGFRQYGNLTSEINLVHGHSFTNPCANNTPSFCSKPPSRNVKPPWAYSYKMKSANMLSQLKQQIEQRPLQVDDVVVQFQHMDSPKLCSEEGNFLQCRQLRREGQISSPLSYNYKRVLMDNNASVPLQSENFLNRSLQMNGCLGPDHLPLLHHNQECRDPMCPVCRTARMKLNIKSQGITTSEFRPPLDNMPPPKRIKLDNPSAYRSCQTGASKMPPVIVDLSPLPQGLSQVSPVLSTFGREETKSRKMDPKALESSSAECHTNLYGVKDSVSENIAVDFGDKPARMKRKINCQVVGSCGIQLSESATPSVGIATYFPPTKHIKLNYTSASRSCQTGASEMPTIVVDPSPYPQGQSQVWHTFGREETESRKMDPSSTEYRAKSYEDKDLVSEDTIVELGDKPSRTNQKNNSQGGDSCGIQLSESATPPIGTTRPLPSKCINLDHTSSHSFQAVTSEKSPLTVDQSHSPQKLSHVCPKMKAVALNGIKSRKMDPEPSSSKESHPESCEAKDGNSDEGTKAEHGDKPKNSVDTVHQCEEEEQQVQTESSKGKREAKRMIISTSSDSPMLGANSEMPKIKGLCLIDSFSPEMVREHIISLRQSDDQENEGKENIQSTECLIDNSSCSLCGKKERYFEYPPKYCGSCSVKICPKGTFYYAIGNAYRAAYGGHTDTVFCVKCYKMEASAGRIMVDDVGISKSHLEMTMDIDDFTEPWVQCGKCEAWQHQICALFNDDLNKAEPVGNEYMCPSCFLKEMEAGVCKPLPQSMVLSAKNLPKTKLSDHLEHWLSRRLEKDRQKRANLSGKNCNEVPGAEGLVIRVVSSINKKLEVNKSFREIFEKEEYPAEFPYKSKAIFLFQKIDGANVCLFGMYVQEFGSECAVPNQRCVCISYLDSVKYFMPEVKAATGEALRTFVYHEILIGYLDYCKKRGFTSCYIWSCPSTNQDDYILYCHPTAQKMPKPQSLREWYGKLIRKAKKKTIVVEHTNLYDHYFKPSCNAKFTASRLPYFDGDCWPREAEKFLKEDMCQKNETKPQSPSEDFNSEDFRIMEHIGKIIRPIKKEFIMVHFQHTCKHCGQHIISGSRWVCCARKHFHLCDKCHSLVQGDRTKTKRKYVYYEVMAESLPADTKDEDGVLHSEHLDTRVTLLNLCQSKFYQFDTLRRAKHTTMMILYHLHKSISTYNLGNDEQKQRQQQFWQKMLDLLIHTSKCTEPSCTYDGCSMLKILFHHGKACQTRVTQGCKHCKKMWLILKLHARNCKESECSVPRCRDWKVFLGRQTGQNQT